MPTPARRQRAAVSSRLAVVERLRRAIFTSSKLLALSALTLAFTGDASAQDLVFDPANDVVVGTGSSLTLGAAELGAVDNDPSKTISLDGGTLTVATTENAQVFLGQNETYPFFKDFAYGQGGEINVKNAASTLGIVATGDGASLVKSGEGALYLISDADQKFGDVTLESGSLAFVGGEVEVDGAFAQKTGTSLFENGATFNASFENGGIAQFLDSVAFKQNASNAGDAYFLGAPIEFEGDFANSGNVLLNAGATFDGFVQNDGYIFFQGGETRFNGGATFANGLATIVPAPVAPDQTTQASVHFASDKTVTVNGAFSLFGNVDVGNATLQQTGLYQANAIVTSSAPLEFRLDENQRIEIGDYALFTVGNQNNNYNGSAIAMWAPTAQVTGYASGLKTDVEFYGGGLFTFGDLMNPLANQNDNQITITYDEYQQATKLLVNNTRQAIDNLQNTGQIVTNRIVTMGEKEQEGVYSSKYGTIAIKTFNTKQSQFGGEYDQADFNGGNFYTVGFNDESETGDELFGEYNGDLNVYTGTAVLMNETVFGGGSGSLSVSGGEFVPADSNLNPNYKVRAYGVFAFDRDSSSTKAPTLRTSWTQFRNGQTANDVGSTLWFNAKNDGSSERNQLATIDSEIFIFEKHLGDGAQPSDAKIWYDGVSTLSSSKVGEITLNTRIVGYLKNGKTLLFDASKLLSDQNPDNDAPVYNALSAIFAKPLVNVDVVDNGLDSQTGKTNFTLEVSAKNVGDYALETGMSAKEQELARKLDGARVEGGNATRFYDALYNETDGGKVGQTLHNLSLLGYNMLNSQGHFGNPTSSFFGGSNLSGEAKRGQSTENDWQPDRQTQSVLQRPTYAPKRNLWAAYTHTSVDGDDYEFGGVATHGYELRRDGVIGGVRRQFDATTSGGLFFGISLPEICSRNALEGGSGFVGSNMEMTDFQFAGHFEKVLADVWELSVYVGGGTQAMDWERDAQFTDGGYYKYEAEGTGNTLTATVYLAYRANLNEALTLRPTIGVDSEHSWLYGFSENAVVAGQGAGAVLLNPYMDNFAQNYNYRKTYYNRNTARVGLTLALDEPTEGMVGLNARAFYGIKLGGDDAPQLSYYSDSYRWDDMSSHEMGESSVNVGGGGYMHLNKQKTFTATGDANAVWYKNAQTFNVTGGVMYRF